MDFIRELLEYSPETGKFIWIVSPCRQIKAFTEAGSTSQCGYRVITVRGKNYKAHRLAWWFVHGKLPAQEIDHINGKKDDNRIENLRDVSRLANERNKHSFRGVSKDGNRYRATISIAKRKIHLGMFISKEEAEGAYATAKKALAL